MKIGRTVNAALTGVLLLSAGSLTSCIDEDLSRCGVNYTIEYKVRMKTDLNATLNEELREGDMTDIRQKLATALGDAFSNKAHDVSLFFYNETELYDSRTHEIGADAFSVTTYLPIKEYNHLYVANDRREPQVVCDTLAAYESDNMIRQVSGDTIDSHRAPLFAGRLPIIITDKDSVYKASLYMQNSASALVIDLNGNDPESIKAYVDGVATSFAVGDSTYSHANPSLVRTTYIEDAARQYCALYGVSFPSRDNALEAASRTDAKGIWAIKAYVAMDGTITENIISVYRPLLAGDLEVITMRLGEGGILRPISSHVGVSVTLDWKPGGEYNPEL